MARRATSAASALTGKMHAGDQRVGTDDHIVTYRRGTTPPHHLSGWRLLHYGHKGAAARQSGQTHPWPASLAEQRIIKSPPVSRHWHLCRPGRAAHWPCRPLPIKKGVGDIGILRNHDFRRDMRRIFSSCTPQRKMARSVLSRRARLQFSAKRPSIARSISVW